MPALPTPTGVPLDPQRLARVKSAYSTRFLASLTAHDASGYSLIKAGARPRPGDVVLARVDTIGKHTRLESPDGRRSHLYPGDEILVAYANRYAPDQFEALVPEALGPTHLVAAGGLAGDVVAAHDNILPPTEIEALGLVADAQGILTLRRCAPLQISADRAGERLRRPNSPAIIGVVGTSMNSGKTTTAAAVVRGLTTAGLHVAAGKVTGSGAGPDPFKFRDAGAATVLDFTDFGFPSTYRLDADTVRDLFVSLVRELSAGSPDAIVIEVADGLLQSETASLIADPVFAELVGQLVFATGDALGAVAGQTILAGHGLPLAAVSGVVTSSPLAMREAQPIVDVPVLDLEQLSDAGVANLLVPRVPAKLTPVDGVAS